MTKDFKNNRIKEIAKYIRPYKKIADVGCDHGYLIVEAFKNHEIDYAIAIDNKQGPLDSAKYNILKYGFNNNVRFSLSSGISDIDDDTEVVIIAGMGGLLINAFSATGMIIIVGVALEVEKQLQTQMMMKNYKGFLK